MIEVVPFVSEWSDEWQRIIRSSNNGTLFHDLNFLAYHPEGRFATHHLIFREAGKTIALLPAAISPGKDGASILRSPYGASIGGFVLARQLSVDTTMRLVEGLREYVVALQLGGIEMCLGPSLYMREPNESLSFGLSAMGFELVRRWLCHVVPLRDGPEAALQRLDRGKARDVRAGRRRGLNPREVGADAITHFYRLLSLNKAKHQAVPTHTEAELSDLFRRVPGSLRLFLCEKDGREVAGVLVFILNEVATYTFYICQDDDLGLPLATTVLLAHVIEQMAGEGFAFLDLGPSSYDDLRLNRGLAFFKEGFGGKGFCRDMWRWENR